MTAPTSHAGAEPAADPILLRRRDGKVLTLTLNRPRAGNALWAGAENLRDGEAEIVAAGLARALAGMGARPA